MLWILGADLGEDLNRLVVFPDVAQGAGQLDSRPEVLGLAQTGCQCNPVRGDRLLLTTCGVVRTGEMEHDVLVSRVLGSQQVEVIDGFLVSLVIDQAVAENDRGLQVLLIGHDPTVPPGSPSDPDRSPVPGAQGEPFHPPVIGTERSVCDPCTSQLRDGGNHGVVAET